MKNNIIFTTNVVCSNIWASSSNKHGTLIAVGFFILAVAALVSTICIKDANHAE